MMTEVHDEHVPGPGSVLRTIWSPDHHLMQSWRSLSTTGYDQPQHCLGGLGIPNLQTRNNNASLGPCIKFSTHSVGQ